MLVVAIQIPAKTAMTPMSGLRHGRRQRGKIKLPSRSIALTVLRFHLMTA